MVQAISKYTVAIMAFFDFWGWHNIYLLRFYSQVTALQQTVQTERMWAYFIAIVKNVFRLKKKSFCGYVSN